MKIDKQSLIGIIGTGTMGTGIAQVAATAGHKVLVYDKSSEALLNARHSLVKIMNRLVEKEKLSQGEADTILNRIEYVDGLSRFEGCSLVIEAVIESLDVKKQIFHQLESVTNSNTVLASNTSSLSIASISGALKDKSRIIGLHFFNPAPLMKLVEIVPALSTRPEITQACKDMLISWNKVTVTAKDTPGFIVNRVARPFYSESIKMLEEGIADAVTIDYALKEVGGFRMGPFELMDLIGNDVNYTVTETVWTQMFYDPKYKPSITQKRLKEAGLFGKKTGKGFHNYGENADATEPIKDRVLLNEITNRVVTMLINEAADALFYNIASSDDIDLAMTKGVNYPKGLLKWANEIGLDKTLRHLEDLQNYYGDDRYRPSIILKEYVKKERNFK